MSILVTVLICLTISLVGFFILWVFVFRERGGDYDFGFDIFIYGSCLVIFVFFVWLCFFAYQFFFGGKP